ncbi:MAG: glycosyltransferase family 4 protein [Chloroflexi bacterium]|nr:glycosyltransferase family 4 protein [Chloroflexota bacterium]
MMNGVVMLVNEFPPIPTGGAERQAERLALYLKDKGWPVYVITRRVGGLPARQDYQGLTVIRPATFGFGKLKTLTFIFGAVFALWSLRSKYSLLHAHLAYGSAFAALLAARLLGKRVIVKFGTSGEFGDVEVSRRTLRGRLRLAALRKWVDVVIALDDSIFDEILSIGIERDRIKRIPNGIEARNFFPAQSKLEAKKKMNLADKVVMIFVGRLSPQKSLPTLLQALEKSLPACSSLHLLLVGDGPDRAALEEQARQLGIDGHVTFLGNQADVRPYLNAADMFVLPSISEGISNSLLEAMSAGLTCVATPVGGNVEILNGGRCGVLLPAGDVFAWSESLTELGNDPQKRESLGLAAQKQALSHFDFGVVGSLYEDLYRGLLALRQ